MREAFTSSRFFPVAPRDLAPVAEEVTQHFRGQGFEVSSERSITNGWRISLHKGGLFKAVVGLKTALNIEIEPVTRGTQVTAGIGIFGQQVVPSLISALVFWPVLLTQLSGMVQNAKLDDEAIRVVEAALQRHAGVRVGAHAPMGTAEAAVGAAVPAGVGVGAGGWTGATVAAPAPRYCTECGAGLGEAARYCDQCGSRA